MQYVFENNAQHKVPRNKRQNIDRATEAERLGAKGTRTRDHKWPCLFSKYFQPECQTHKGHASTKLPKVTQTVTATACHPALKHSRKQGCTPRGLHSLRQMCRPTIGHPEQTTSQHSSTPDRRAKAHNDDTRPHSQHASASCRATSKKRQFTHIGTYIYAMAGLSFVLISFPLNPQKMGCPVSPTTSKTKSSKSSVSLESSSLRASVEA